MFIPQILGTPHLAFGLAASSPLTGHLVTVVESCHDILTIKLIGIGEMGW
jgi:hypothetical protein